jgi:hypothetical protein
MEIKSAFDPAFQSYCRIDTEFDTAELLTRMESTPLPDGVHYIASEPALEALPIFDALRCSAFGGMDIQLGFCNGHNFRLDAVEYHKSSEWNLACTDLILLLGRVQDIDPVSLTYDTGTMEAFLVPAGTAFETYATTLHYAPCSVAGAGFRLVVVLPRATNLPLSFPVGKEGRDRLLFCRNKWLIAHPDAGIPGAYAGLLGENLCVNS